MKASELIEALQALVAEHGDLLVYGAAEVAEHQVGEVTFYDGKLILDA